MHRLTAAEAREITDKTEPRKLKKIDWQLMEILAAAKTGGSAIVIYLRTGMDLDYDMLDELKAMGYVVYTDDSNKSYTVDWSKPNQADEESIDDALRMNYLYKSVLEDDCFDSNDRLADMLSRIEYLARIGHSYTLMTKPSAKGAIPDLNKCEGWPTDEEILDAFDKLEKLGYTITLEDDNEYVISW